MPEEVKLLIMIAWPAQSACPNLSVYVQILKKRKKKDKLIGDFNLAIIQS